MVGLFCFMCKYLLGTTARLLGRNNTADTEKGKRPSAQCMSH